MPAPGLKKRGRTVAASAATKCAPDAPSDRTTDKTDASQAKAMSVLLSSLCTSQDEKLLSKAIDTLREYFVEMLLDDDILSSKPDESDIPSHQSEGSPARVRDQYLLFRGHLLQLLGRRAVPCTVQCPALHALMECARVEHQGSFSNELYWDLLQSAITGQEFNAELLGVLAGAYLKYADVRFHTWSAVRRIAESRVHTTTTSPSSKHNNSNNINNQGQGREDQAPAEDVVRNLYDVMANTPLVFETVDLTTCADHDKESGTASWALQGATPDASGVKRVRVAGRGEDVKPKWSDEKQQKQMFSKAWLALLQLELPEDIYKKVLSRVHLAVIPHMVNPLLLSDFLTKSIDKGGLIGILSLNGIFVLVQHHGLEYPQFYDRLYSLLDAQAFHTRYRKRFFDLMDVFLKSPLLPAYIGAAFAKRFARLAISAPPSGAIVAVSFIHNLLRRHPSCSVMVHRERDIELEDQPADLKDVAAAMRALDPFLPDEQNPSKANALKSSLWELQALQQSVYPQVVKFVKVLEKDLTERRKTTEMPTADTTGYSYQSLLDEELGQKMKRAPLAFYETLPKTLLDPSALCGSFPGWDLSWNIERVV
mmetsp:Transcript_16956/g.32481  ORF Transcript_16956/g.32481 Transcript_16956/m.32481 type:complete len:595 (+) Transcript_16956:111-1895(+)